MFAGVRGFLSFTIAHAQIERWQIPGMIPESRTERLILRPLEMTAYRLIESSMVTQKFIEERPQILRFTTPKLKGVWGPVRSG